MKSSTCRSHGPGRVSGTLCVIPNGDGAAARALPADDDDVEEVLKELAWVDVGRLSLVRDDDGRAPDGVLAGAAVHRARRLGGLARLSLPLRDLGVVTVEREVEE